MKNLIENRPENKAENRMKTGQKRGLSYQNPTFLSELNLNMNTPGLRYGVGVLYTSPLYGVQTKNSKLWPRPYYAPGNLKSAFSLCKSTQ